jgi:hypothetical protein
VPSAEAAGAPVEDPPPLPLRAAQQQTASRRRPLLRTRSCSAC